MPVFHILQRMPLRNLVIQHGLVTKVLAFLRAHEPQVVEQIGDRKRARGEDIGLVHGGSVWTGGPKSILLGGVTNLEPGFDLFGLGKKLSEPPTEHPDWVHIGLRFSHWFFTRKAAKQMLADLTSERVRRWDREYTEGFEEAMEQAVRRGHVVRLGRLPTIPGEH